METKKVICSYKTYLFLLFTYLVHYIYYVLYFLNIGDRPSKINMFYILINLFMVSVFPFFLNRFLIKTLISIKYRSAVLRISKFILTFQIIVFIFTFNINSDFPKMLSRKDFVFSKVNKFTMFFIINSLFNLVNLSTLKEIDEINIK